MQAERLFLHKGAESRTNLVGTGVLDGPFMP